jgi:hypothetical protein
MQRKLCLEEFEHVRGFKLHLKHVHSMSRMEYVIKVDHGGAI